MPTLPADRNLTGELGHIGVGGITAGINQLLGAHYDNYRQFGGAYTAQNLQHYGDALSGVTGFADAWAAANPGLASYTAGLGGLLTQLRGNAPGGYAPLGYNATQATAANAGPAEQARFTGAGPAAQAGFNPAAAYTSGLSQAMAAQAAQQRAQGGPLLGQLQQDAMRSIGGVSALQNRQQQIAMGLLGGSGGDLTAQERGAVQQDTRAAYAARGLYDSNQAIGAEIMNTDAARRQRLVQNLGLAQGVDAAGQQQLGATRNFALGVQGQGQQLSQFNAGQGNQLSQFNAGLLTNTSQFNAGEGNRVGMFNAGQQQQNSQFNAGLGAQISQFNAGARNNMAQFDAGQQNQLGQFNAQLGTQNNQYNAGLLQQAGLYNAGATDAAQQYNVGAVNQAGQFNAQLQGQNNAQNWQQALQLGQFQQQQAVNPYALAGQLQGQVPDYTAGLLGYGGDVYNTNYNSHMARYLGAQNKDAGMWSAGLGAIGTIGGAIVGGPMGAAIGNRLGTWAGGAIGGSG
jgi:hypothetical protein